MYPVTMKLWIDDLRPAPDDTWVIAKTSADALRILRAYHDLHLSRIEVISFDHDLGGDDTSRRVMRWLITSKHWPKEIRVHSFNPIGREYLVEMARHYAPKSVRVMG